MTSSYPPVLAVRHGETQWNVAGRLQGRQDTPLTANGLRQVLAVGLRLAEKVHALDDVRFWVSPLPRARQTASILSDAWGVPFDRFVPETALVERAYGEWEGLSLSEIQKNLPEQYAASAADPWGYAIPGGESRRDLADRLSSWLHNLELAATHVVIAHSGTLRALRGYYTGSSLEAMLAYREPQTAAFWLEDNKDTQLNVSPSMLQALGCESEGRTVWI
jgi:broad specificity phosphatase PhoE